jgi:hypothetical protein
VLIGAPESGRRTPKEKTMQNPKALARLAGGLYLLLAVLGGWANFATRGSVFVAGDAAATRDNIVANEALLRWGLAADVAMALVFVILGLVLFRLLHAENARQATALIVFVSVGAGSILLNLVFHAAAIVVATEPAYAQLGEALPLLMLDLHRYGYLLGGIFFGLWLLPLGLIALRSPLFHRFVGPVVVVGAIAWLFDPVLAFVLPAELDLVRQIVSLPTAIAEFGLIVYLLVVGVRTPKPAS